MTYCSVGNNYAGLNGGGAYAAGNGEENSGCLSYCIISGNTARNEGGGIYDVSMTNCLLNGNSAAYGGGAFYDTPFLPILNCTIAKNGAVDNGGGIYWTGLPQTEVLNCIIYANSAPTNMNYGPTNALNFSHDPFSPLQGGFFNCTMPLPLAAPGQNNSNFTDDPAFVNPAAGDFHLQSYSPCINSGTNASVVGSTDLDGNPRIVGGTVDMGAYEYQTPASMVSYHWLQQYGLPITTNTDASSPNGTSFDVYQDWIAGLNPTNPASVLVMLSPPPTNNVSGIMVTWESVTNIPYNLQRTTNVTSAFTTIQANITGHAGTTSYTDTTATSNGPYFYRVVVP